MLFYAFLLNTILHSILSWLFYPIIPILSYCFLSYPNYSIQSYSVIAYPTLSYSIVSKSIQSNPISYLSNHYPILSYFTLLYAIASFRILSYILFYTILSYPTSYSISLYPILFSHIRLDVVIPFLFLGCLDCLLVAGLPGAKALWQCAFRFHAKSGLIIRGFNYL